jgi:membrane protein
MSKQPRQNTEPKSPVKISGSGWKSIVMTVKDSIGEDNVAIVSAGVAFYAFLAVFPAIMALISIYGLAMDPQQIESQISQLSSMLPEQAFGIIETQIEKFTSTSGETLSWGTALGILFSLWSANKGIKSLFTGVDIAYNTKNTRGLIQQNALTLAFTLGAIILVILSMILIVAFPALVDQIGLPSQIENLISWLRWVVLAIIVVLFLCLIYKFAPARPRPRFRWVLPGAMVATVLWLIASWGFSYYVSNFGSYGEVYGSISAVVVLMLWLLLTSLIILVGAELNSVSEEYARNAGSSKDHYNSKPVG